MINEGHMMTDLTTDLPNRMLEELDLQESVGSKFHEWTEDVPPQERQRAILEIEADARPSILESMDADHAALVGPHDGENREAPPDELETSPPRNSEPTTTMARASGLALDTLAETIKAHLVKADKANVDFQNHRITAGQHLHEAKKRVEAGEAGVIRWRVWCEKHIDRSDRDIRRLLAIASSSSPVEAAEAERDRNRSDVAAHRKRKELEARTYVSPLLMPLGMTHESPSAPTIAPTTKPTRAMVKRQPDAKAVIDPRPLVTRGEQSRLPMFRALWRTLTEGEKAEFLADIGAVRS
jgi:hypothetical protein